MMATDATPTFEVAAIKLSRPDEKGLSIGFQGQQFVTKSASLMNLISFAYGVHFKQIMNAPSWAEKGTILPQNQT
jgi:uncharacterized protein (TIGR03435 family)